MNDNFTILHIAKVNNDGGSGVSVVVPQHIAAQSKWATVGLVNIADGFGVQEGQFECPKTFSVKSLPDPYDRPDIVVFHEVYRKEFLKIAKNLRKDNIPYVILPHGSLSKEAQKNGHFKKLVANILFFGSFIRNAKAIQCLAQDDCDGFYHKNKFIGTNGTPLPLVRKTQFSKEEFKFLYVGRLEPYHKGLDLLIAAAKMCRSFLREKRCKIYIYGPDKKGRRAILEELIRENDVMSEVILMDGVYGCDKERVLLDADCFIQPSRSEGMPLGILEALSYGVPCIVTKGTRLLQYVSDYNAGWLCEADPSSIADAIVQAVNERELCAVKSDGARKLIEDNFIWEKVSYTAVSEYKKLVL